MKQFAVEKTEDGSLSVRDAETGELHHNRAGAYTEALLNYVLPSGVLERTEELDGKVELRGEVPPHSELTPHGEVLRNLEVLPHGRVAPKRNVTLDWKMKAGGPKRSL